MTGRVDIYISAFLRPTSSCSKISKLETLKLSKAIVLFAVSRRNIPLSNYIYTLFKPTSMSTVDLEL